jgi:hypothetical protein
LNSIGFSSDKSSPPFLLRSVLAVVVKENQSHSLIVLINSVFSDGPRGAFAQQSKALASSEVVGYL